MLYALRLLIAYSMQTGDLGMRLCASLVPRPLPDLSRSSGEKSGEGLRSKLRHRSETVDSVST